MSDVIIIILILCCCSSSIIPVAWLYGLFGSLFGKKSFISYPGFISNVESAIYKDKDCEKLKKLQKEGQNLVKLTDDIKRIIMNSRKTLGFGKYSYDNLSRYQKDTKELCSDIYYI